MFKYDYWFREKGVSEKVCKAIIDDIDWGKASEGTIFDSNIKKYVIDVDMRRTNVVWHKEALDIGMIISAAYINAANIEADWSFILSSLEQVQIAKYSTEGHYDWHVDSQITLDNEGTTRKLSFVALLNDPSEFDGGVLEIESFDGTQIYTNEMKCGSVVVFPSCLKHRVTPVTKGTRYSAVGWASGPLFK